MWVCLGGCSSAVWATRPKIERGSEHGNDKVPTPILGDKN